MVARDLELVRADRRALPRRARHQRATRCALVREAKRRGLPVTCEVTPHHLTLTDEACASYDTAHQVHPAAAHGGRRRGAARGARRRHHRRDRHRPRAALAGREGRRVRAGGVRHDRARDRAAADARARARRGCSTPARAGDAHERRRRRRCFGLPGGTLADGGAGRRHGDRPRAAWTVRRAARCGRSSKNTPFSGQTLRGRAVLTLVGGTIAYSRRDADVSHDDESTLPPALLALEDGTVYRGVGFGARRRRRRRGRVQHLDHRLPGGPDRPVVPRADRRR